MSKIKPGDIISYREMCMKEDASLQRGMNYKIRGKASVILMSLRKGAPYEDEVNQDGQILIYEGHDVPKNENKNPKSVSQLECTRNGKHTQNGKFFQAAMKYKDGLQAPELVKVYEKIKDGIWVYNGVFELIDAWLQDVGIRKVFKFKLKITNKTINERNRRRESDDLEHNRLIPSSVKFEVWKRDKGRCTKCGSADNLHYDHVLPFSKGGTSLMAENIQLLCARHNLKKSDKIE